MIEIVGWAYFDDFTCVHHRNAVTDVLNHGQVVGDEEIGQATFLLQAFEQVNYLGLNGHVQGRNGLIGNDEAWLERQGPGNP